MPKPAAIDVKVEDGHAVFTTEDASLIPLTGTLRAILANMVKGVSEGFERKLELVGVAAPDWYTGPAIAGGVGVDVLRVEIEQAVRESLESAAHDLPIAATTALREGDPADELAEHSAQLDLLLTGSRGYGPLRSVITGGVSGRVIRSARCPVVVVPRGAEAALQIAAA